MNDHTCLLHTYRTECHAGTHSQQTRGGWANVVLMLGRRRRRRASIETTLAQPPVFAVLTKNNHQYNYQRIYMMYRQGSPWKTMAVLISNKIMWILLSDFPVRLFSSGFLRLSLISIYTSTCLFNISAAQTTGRLRPVRTHYSSQGFTFSRYWYYDKEVS